MFVQNRWVRFAVLGMLSLIMACGGNTPTKPADTSPPSNDPGAESGPNFPTTLPSPTSPSADGNWSNAATWGTAVPKDGDYVLIPAGKTIRLDTNTAFLSGLRIEGTLIFDDNGPRKLVSRFVLVKDGLLQIGTEVVPFKNKAIITLTGTDKTVNVIGASPMKMGTKFIGTYMGSGKIEIHGARRDALSWTQLEGNVQPGATSITLKDSASSWRINDEIVIASSSFDPSEAERLTVTAVNGNTVSFKPTLKYPHWGTIQTYEGKTFDQRAEVGLLTRDVVIQGADDSAAINFGGHAMMMGQHARVEGVEFRNMGQAGLAGRYSFHWHFAGTQEDDYFKNNSVHDAFQRAVVVHQTNKVLVENNVAYNVFNHMYVPSEDGNEEGSRFIRNLGILSKSPEEKDFAFRVDSSLFGNSTQGEFRSSVFWGRNFGGTFIGNHAAGALNGNGFFFDSFNSVSQPKDNGPLKFEGNVAHSIMREGARGLNAETYPEMTFGQGFMFGGENMGGVARAITNSHAYKSFGGYWAEDRELTVKDSLASDNGASVFILRSILDGVTIVSQTANALGERPQAGDPFVKGAIVAPPSHGMARGPILRDVTVVNESETAINYIRHEFVLGARIDKLKLVNVGRAFRTISEPFYEYGFTEDSLLDPNGQLLADGKPVQWVHLRSNILDGRCTWYEAKNAGACPINQGFKMIVPDVGRGSLRPGFLVQNNGRTIPFADPLGRESSAYVLNGGRYQVAWQDNNVDTSANFLLENSNGQSVELVFAATGAPSSIAQNSTNISAVSNAAALSSSSVSAYFFDAAQQKLFVKLKGATGTQTVAIAAPFSNKAPTRTAINVSNVTAGLKRTAYTGTWAAPFVNTSALTAGASSNVNGSDITSLQPGGSLVLEGYLNVPQTGLYQIGSNAKRMTNMDWYLHGEHLLSEYKGNNVEINEFAAVLLEQGLHPIRLVMTRPSNAEGTAELDFYWKKIDSTLGPVFDYAEIPANAFQRAP